MSDFDAAVGRIARKRAIHFFAKRALFATLIVTVAIGLAGCQPTQACIGGKLYERYNGDEVFIQDEWQRNCVDPTSKGTSDE